MNNLAELGDSSARVCGGTQEFSLNVVSTAGLQVLQLELEVISQLVCQGGQSRPDSLSLEFRLCIGSNSCL